MDPLDPSRADHRQALFGGTGTVRVWSLTRPLAPFTAVLWCELEPGGRVGAHRQEHDDEVVIVVAGSARLRVNGVEHALGAGGTVGLPLGALLEIENADAEHPLAYLIVKARRTSEFG